MRKKALLVEEREIQVINWFVIRIQHDNEEYATVHEIAKGLGMSPSSHLRGIVNGLVEKGSLEVKDLDRSGRWPSRGYMLRKGTFQRPTKQTIKMNFTIKGIRQMELIQMNHYPTSDGFKDEREEPQDRLIGHWHYISDPCPSCGGRVQEKHVEHDGLLEVSQQCDDCGWVNVLYE